MAADEVARRLEAARQSMIRSAGATADEAALDQLKTKCAQATKQMERS